MNYFTATYSPEDNKLRLSAVSRLEPELYARVKAAGFRWAPMQQGGIFVAPMWTPEREDLLLELAGEIDDEDKSLVERAEERADRFEDYQEKRTAEAESARKAVDAIADGIPLGQPIMVGHHSEKHARRDAERIRSGMANAVRLWDTAQYWKSRAKGALRHAKYKELPQVRHRRIKTLVADRARVGRQRAELMLWRDAWAAEDLTLERAITLARRSYGHTDVEKGLEARTMTVEEAVDLKVSASDRSLARLDRWLAHYDNRIEYETAMLDEQVGTGELGKGMAGRFDVAVGGQVLVRGEWCVILKVNKGTDGTVSSVTTTAPKVVTWTKKWNVGIEKVLDYKPPTAEDVERVKAATRLPPLCNYPGEGFKQMVELEWKRVSRSSDSSHIRVVDATPTAGRHRARFTMLPGWNRAQVFVTDIKRVDPPAPKLLSGETATMVVVDEPVFSPSNEETKNNAPTLNLGDLVTYEDKPGEVELDVAQVSQSQADTIFGEPLTLAPLVQAGLWRPIETGDAFEAMRQAAKKGVEVVVVRNLFPTPAAVADRVVSLLAIQPGDRVLEPSAGTGQLLDAIARAGATPVTIDAVEINQTLARALIERAPYPHLFVRCGDFLEMNVGHLGDIGRFDKILMNPPFENGVDVKHVKHALTMLKQWGRLVAIMADGPRQREFVEASAAHCESLPPGTFEGTQVRAMIAVFE